MSKPLVIELFCGMFGWSAGWLALGGEAIGFDIEHQPYHGPVPKGAHLVLQDVLTLHGSQFKDASTDSRELALPSVQLHGDAVEFESKPDRAGAQAVRTCPPRATTGTANHCGS